MRILVLHNRYLTGALSGENRVVDAEAALLREGGHDVDFLGPSPGRLSAPALAARTLASVGVARTVHDRVRRDRVDVVHAHNLYPAYGARTLAAASNAGAAVVLTLQNYRLMCVAGTFFRNGHVCEDCLNRRPRWPGVVHGCYRGSRAQSAVLSMAIAGARAAGVYASVHRFLSVSSFMREKHVDAGFPAERIVVKPNFVPPALQRTGPGTYFLAVSRLVAEKGISEIVGAWDKDLGELRIAGDGPEREKLERLANGRGVHFEGALSPEQLPALVAGARALLVPSTWYEGHPRVILEAYAAGVPVIASRIGGLVEAVIEDETGFTVETGDAAGWRDAARQLCEDELSVRLGRAAHSLWANRFSPERGLAMLEESYAQALSAKRGVVASS